MNIPQQAQLGSINLKLYKLDYFDCKRNFLTLSTWQKYMSLELLSNPHANITDESHISFVSSFITHNDTSWC